MRVIKSCFVSATFTAILCVIGNVASAQTPSPESQFVVLHSGLDGSSPRKRTRLISDQTQYAAELAARTNGTGTPAIINFSAGRVVLMDMGSRTTVGYSVVLTSVDVSTDFVVANIRLTKPGSNCSQVTNSSSPYQFAYIPTLKEILFRETIAAVNC